MSQSTSIIFYSSNFNVSGKTLSLEAAHVKDTLFMKVYLEENKKSYYKIL